MWRPSPVSGSAHRRVAQNTEVRVPKIAEDGLAEHPVPQRHDALIEGLERHPDGHVLDPGVEYLRRDGGRVRDGGGAGRGQGRRAATSNRPPKPSPRRTSEPPSLAFARIFMIAKFRPRPSSNALSPKMSEIITGASKIWSSAVRFATGRHVCPGMYLSNASNHSVRRGPTHRHPMMQRLTVLATRPSNV